MMTHHPEAAIDRALAAAQIINARRKVYGETQGQKLAYYAQGVVLGVGREAALPQPDRGMADGLCDRLPAAWPSYD